MYSKFDEISNEAKAWVYQSDRALSDNEVVEINKLIVDFINTWTAHEQIVKGFGEVQYNRFIVLFADSYTSGCSIDTSIHFIKKLGIQYNINFFDRLSIAFLDNNNSIETFKTKDFQHLFENKILIENTLIFNNLVHTKSEFLSNWEIQIKESFLKDKAL